MRKILFVVLMSLIALTSAAQNFGFSYQAVALDRARGQSFGYDSEGKPLSNREITVRFALSEGNADGQTAYQETHITKTDEFGMFRLIVGRGTRDDNTPLHLLNWGALPYFMHVEVDYGFGFEYMGVEELLGSPYSFSATSQRLELVGNVLKISNGNEVVLYDLDSNNEIQDLSLTGNTLTITNNGTATDIDLSPYLDNTDTQLTEAQVDAFASNNGYLTSEVDGSITNEIQDLSLTGNTLTITNNGTATDIDLSPYLDNTDTQLTEAQVDAFASNNGYLTSEVDGSITNEIQDLSLTGNTLTITNNGTATDIDLSPYLDNTDTQLTEAQVDAFTSNNGYLTSEVDGSITNEIQDLSLTGNTLTITNNGTATDIDLSPYLDNTDTQLTEAQVDAFASNNGYLTSEVDGSMTNEIQDLSLTGNTLTITNNGTATDIDLSPYLDNTDTQLTEAQVDAFTSNNGYLTSEVDGSMTNEIQDLSLTGNTLTITNNGTATDIDLSPYLDNTDTQLTEAQVDAFTSNNGYLTSEVDGSITNEIQDLSLTGNTLTITNNGTATDIDLSPYLDNTDTQLTEAQVDAFASNNGYLTSEVDGSMTNEIQDLSLTGNTLTITNNGTATDIDLSPYLDNTDTQLTEAQVDAFTSNNGYLTSEVDGSMTNEIQDLSLTGNTLTITNNGTATDIDLSPYLDNTDTQLTEAQVDAFTSNNGYLTSEVDGSITNEIQDLSLTGNTLTITNNGTATDIDLSPYLDNTDTQLTEAQVDAFASNNGYLTSEVDGSMTNEIQDLSLTGNTLTITNNGTATDIDLSPYLDNTDTQLTEAQVDAFTSNNGYLTSEVDGSMTNEIQDLSLTGNTLTITNNGTATDIDLSPYLDNTDTQLTEAQVDAFASNNGYLTSEVDGSITNEIQDLSLTGNTLTITNNGTATDIDLSPYLDNTDTQLTEAQVDAFASNNGYLTSEVDGSMTNETNTAFTVSAGNLQITDSNGTLSVPVTSLQAANVWKTIGNAGTSATTNFVGTTDDQDLSFRVNNSRKLLLTTQGTLEFLNTGGSVFIGENAGLNDDLDNNLNIFIGTDAGRSNTTGIANVANGHASLYSNISGNYNVAYGTESLHENTIGSSNVASGYQSLYSNTTGQYSVANGYQSLYENRTGFYNVANGYKALHQNTTGNANVAIGEQSLYLNTTGSYNVATGARTLYRNTTGIENAANGAQSLYSNTTGKNNVAYGYRALGSNTTGSSNTGLGNYTGHGITTGSYNTILGANVTGLSADLSNNIILSDGQNIEMHYATNVWDFKNNDLKVNNLTANQLLYANNNKQLTSLADGIAGQVLQTNGSGAYSWTTPSMDWSTTGNNGTNPTSHFIGTTDNQNLSFRVNNSQKLLLTSKGTLAFSNTGGSVFIGDHAGQNDDLTNNFNVFVGTDAGRSNTTGPANVASGYQSLYSNTSGNNNVANGNQSLYSNTEGNVNVAIGAFSLYSNTIGTRNVASGYQSLYSNTTGHFNVANGYQSLYFNTTGRENVAIGYYAGPNLGSLTNTIALGYFAQPTSSNTAVIGNSSTTSIGGAVAWSVISDGRFKTKVQEDVPGLDFVLKLRPVTYSWDMDKLTTFQGIPDHVRQNAANQEAYVIKETKRHTGFIAQEVEEVANSVGYDFDAIITPENEKSHYTLSYAEFVVPLVKAVQEQQATIEQQQQSIAEKEQQVNDLNERLKRLEDMVQKLAKNN